MIRDVDTGNATILVTGEDADLAIKLKIKSVVLQRENIRRRWNDKLKDPPSDGDMTLRYVGILFPEVEEYFKNLGFDITKVQEPNRFLPSNIFSISPHIKLTEEQTREAELYQEWLDTKMHSSVDPWEIFKVKALRRAADGDSEEDLEDISADESFDEDTEEDFGDDFDEGFDDDFDEDFDDDDETDDEDEEGDGNNKNNQGGILSRLWQIH